MLLPEIDLSVPQIIDPNEPQIMYFGGFEICFDLYSMPYVDILFMRISLEWALVIPAVAWLLRRVVEM